MTEAAWLTCNDPSAMLAFLEGSASVRKLRLFCVACFRRLWANLPEEAHAAVNTLDLHLGGHASSGDLSRIADAIHHQWWDAAWTGPADALYAAYRATSGTLGVEAVASIARVLAALQQDPTEARAERAAQVHILRDLFGNPFRLISISPERRTGEVISIAAEIDQYSHLNRFAELGDALSRTGYSGPVLSHLRSPGPHARGCWALDLILRQTSGRRPAQERLEATGVTEP